MSNTEKNNLARFGFYFEQTGVHTSRTLMLDELEVLLSYLDNSGADKADYLKAIDDENCLGKRTQANRKLTYRHLANLFTLEPSMAIFRSLLYFWQRDQQGRPLLGLLCGYCCD